MPSQLALSAMDLAARLIGVPQSKAPAGQAAEREAGYIMLGALALALPAGQVAAQRAELLELWRVALAPDAAAELDVKKYLQVRLAFHTAILCPSRDNSLAKCSLQAYAGHLDKCPVTLNLLITLSKGMTLPSSRTSRGDLADDLDHGPTPLCRQAGEVVAYCMTLTANV